MASVYWRNNRWYLRFKTARGWRAVASSARSKTEAKRLATEAELRAERQRLGLEELPPEDGGGTLAELLGWWLKTYVSQTSSHRRTASVMERHFLHSEIAGVRLAELTSGKIEVFLQARADSLSANTLNHFRVFLVTAFNRARRAGRWRGANPALDVRRRTVPKRLPDFLRAEEVPLVLAALPERNRPLFAAAIFTGMRKGELAGLRKSDVDLRAGLINVSRSYDGSTTKGSRAAAIPIAAELRPHLVAALARTRSELVFPGPDGKRMLSGHSPLEHVLRRALAHAGIVTGYTHVCRKQGCGYTKVFADPRQRRCPKHRHLLWPKANVRRIRFHDLRHTTASLLMMAGANPAAVQRILRHSDPRITTETYGHLLPGYLRAEVDRLTFGESMASLPEASVSPPLVTPLLPGSTEPRPDDDAPGVEPPDSQPIQLARPARFERATCGFEVRCSIQLS